MDGRLGVYEGLLFPLKTDLSVAPERRTHPLSLPSTSSTASSIYFAMKVFFFFRNYPQFCSTTCLQWCSGILALSSSLPKETNALVLQSFSLSSSKQISFQSFNAHANITGDAIALGLSQISNWLSRVSSAIFNRTEFWESKACSVLLINMMFEKKKKKNFEKRCSYS